MKLVLNSSDSKFVAPQSKGRKVFLITAHGRMELMAQPQERLLDVLVRNQIPWSAVTPYKISEFQNKSEIYPCLDGTLSDLSSDENLYLYYSRNVDLERFKMRNFRVVPHQGEAATTEFIYRDLKSASGKRDEPFILKKMSSEECKTAVSTCAHDVLEANISPGAKVVVGISGGGDSNALLNALTRFKKFNVEWKPVILGGIPDWDHGIPRAQELCRQYGLPLKVVSESETRKLLEMKDSSEPLISRFERYFPGDDFEFLGTLLIRKCLINEAKISGTNTICTGLNLEDLFAESLYRISNGKAPLPAPVRAVNGIKSLFPLWQVPKRIIDGCFPKYSLENYEARYPCFSYGRSLYYEMAYTLQSTYPGMPERLLSGLTQLSGESSHHFIDDADLGFETLGSVPFPLKQRFIAMLRE